MRFEEQIVRSIDRQSAETAGSRRQLRVIEVKTRNCTEAIASMGWSTFPRAPLQDLESQHQELADKLAALEPRVVKSTFRDTRRFVEARLKNLQSILTGEPRLVRAEIAKHVEKITLTPEGRTYIAAGTWDLLGGVAARMVPGARLVHSSPSIEFQIEVAA